MNRREELRGKIGHLKEVQALLLRGKEDGLVREVRRLIEVYEKEVLGGKRTGKWDY
jgi:hypothetical protein